MADLLSKKNLTEVAITLAIAALGMYLIANHTSAATASKFGLTYVVTA